jgi:hypothetical protein
MAAASALNAQQHDANPVVSSAKEIYARQSVYILAAADQMPANKYAFHPTPDQWTFGKIVSHVVLANDHVCAMLIDAPPPDASALTQTTPKDALMAALRASFDYCGKAMDALEDSRLGDTITFFGGVKKPRARALLELTGDLEDHYSQMAGYLRLNAILPPSAKPKN